MRTLMRRLRNAWRRPAALVLAVLAGCFALASAADARADLAGRNRALTKVIQNLDQNGRDITVSANYADFADVNELPGDNARPRQLDEVADEDRVAVVELHDGFKA